MKILTIIARVLLGLVFIAFGCNTFINFIPAPPMPGPAGEFISALTATGYLQAIGALQLIGGLLLVSGFFVPLGLLILGPIIVNILFFHIFLEPMGLGMAIVVGLIALFLVSQYRSAFAGFWRAS